LKNNIGAASVDTSRVTPTNRHPVPTSLSRYSTLLAVIASLTLFHLHLYFLATGNWWLDAATFRGLEYRGIISSFKLGA
jgi:hypothetical protein